MLYWWIYFDLVDVSSLNVLSQYYTECTLYILAGKLQGKSITLMIPSKNESTQKMKLPTSENCNHYICVFPAMTCQNVCCKNTQKRLRNICNRRTSLEATRQPFLDEEKYRRDSFPKKFFRGVWNSSLAAFFSHVRRCRRRSPQTFPSTNFTLSSSRKEGTFLSSSMATLKRWHNLAPLKQKKGNLLAAVLNYPLNSRRDSVTLLYVLF